MLMSVPRFELNIDRDRFGSPRLTKQGHYRFSITMMDTDSDDGHLTLKGFRYDPKLKKVMCPVVSLPKGNYEMAALSRPAEEIISRTFEQLSEQAKAREQEEMDAIPGQG